MQQDGFRTVEEGNAYYHRLLSQGVTELTVDVDLPTRLGYDSDHPLAEGEVGRTGVAIDSIEDMQALFNNIPLENVFTSMNIDAAGFILLAFYTVLAKQQGADLKKMAGASHSGSTHIYPPQPSMRIIRDISGWCSRELPEWDLISTPDSHSIPVSKEDDHIHQVQIEKLASFRKRRDPARCDSILQELIDIAASEENIMPVVVQAAENRCTLGEIADTLREVFGEYK